jgi:hypothetical protein
MSLSGRLEASSSIRLRDGRTLGMATVGKADGLPIFGVNISNLAFCTLSLLKHRIGNPFVREE